MRYFVEIGENMEDARIKVKEKYGDAANITHYKTITTRRFGLFPKKSCEVSGFILEKEKVQVQNSMDKRDEGEKQKILELSRTVNLLKKNEIKEKDNNENLILEEIKKLSKEVNLIKNRSEVNTENPANINKFLDVLRDNDFEKEVLNLFVSDLKKSLKLEEIEEYKNVENFFLTWLEDKIKIYDFSKMDKRKIMIFLGTTGVGKTTTIVKLCVHFGIPMDERRDIKSPEEKKDVRIITIDNYKIGGLDQLQNYGRMMGFPVKGVNGIKDLENTLKLWDGADYIFLDTTGKGPNDFTSLRAMQETLSVCKKLASVHLVINASTNYKDIKNVLSQFEPFGYESILITKVDEASSLGGVLSALIVKDKVVSYITDGQKVPTDIKPASHSYIISMLNNINSKVIGAN